MKSSMLGAKIQPLNGFILAHIAYWYTSEMSPLTGSLLMLGAEIQPVNGFILTPAK